METLKSHQFQLLKKPNQTEKMLPKKKTKPNQTDKILAWKKPNQTKPAKFQLGKNKPNQTKFGHEKNKANQTSQIFAWKNQTKLNRKKTVNLLEEG